jgi:ATP-dependent DNA ligase
MPANPVLRLNGEDLRERPLIERKRLLRSIVLEQSLALLYTGPHRAAWHRVFPAGM